jgi:hypothetical protein
MSGGLPAGSSRVLRLDPFALPVRFSASDAAADGRSREVELTRERVVVRRAVAGIRMAVNLPVSAYRGGAFRVSDAGAAVVLVHRDPALALELYIAPDGDEVAAQWRTWGDVLGVPLLIADDVGELQEPFARIGAVRIKPPCVRRRRRNAIKRRRPSILMRRVVKRVGAVAVHRGEREIIARN